MPGQPGLVAVVLAAGQGKRMKSRVPKVLHSVAGRPLVHYPVAAALEAGATQVIVVVSPESQAAIEAHVNAAFPPGAVRTAVQTVARGTGDAAKVALEGGAGAAFTRVLVLCGDTPLVRASELRLLLGALDSESAKLALLSCEPPDPRGYGRVIRDATGRALSVQEDRDLDAASRETLREVNAGVYAVDGTTLREGLATLRADNSQGEYYLTDVVAYAAGQRGAVAVKGSPDALVGVNDRSQLSQAEEAMYRRIAERHRVAGVTVRGDARIDDTVEISIDACIEAGACLRGNTTVGEGALVDVGAVVTDTTIAAGANVRAYSVLDGSRIGARAEIGPFARIRPGSDIEEEAHIGNFVEAKKTHMGRGAKANHLAYLGDGEIGAGANVGAGTIFCNYDGFVKHVTVIGEGAFIGSDSQLVAPVRIGKGAYVATGTTVTQDVPDDALAIGRTKQENKLGYASRLKSRLAARKKK
ncbi:MAG TPA: bifunctional UDP-N-acetylglucosamine diphosphorylase/glucosamine-1-phosphate N-acetyltransferase GlmU [Polyangiaceae bacterium]